MPLQEILPKQKNETHGPVGGSVDRPIALVKHPSLPTRIGPWKAPRGEKRTWKRYSHRTSKPA